MKCIESSPVDSLDLKCENRCAMYLDVHLAAAAVGRPLAGQGVVDAEAVGVGLEVRLRGRRAGP